MNGVKPMRREETTLIALSGGIDSAVAAALLRRDESRPVGVFMRHPFQPTLSRAEAEAFYSSFSADGGKIDVFSPILSDSSGGLASFSSATWNPDLCPFPADAADAEKIARFLDVPFFLFDAEPIFRRVTDDFTRQYLDGRTPNPCVLCNRILKFGALVQLADYLNLRFFATGHYARTESASQWANRLEKTVDLPAWLRNSSDETPALLTADSSKDQSYVLYGIERRVLSRLRFPVGGWMKEEVRRKGRELGLPLAPRRESQDICFIPDGRNAEFVQRFGDGRPTAGEFVSETGTVLGHHSGYERFTVGQRKGLGIGFGERTFVQRIDAGTRRVVLGPRESLAQTEIDAESGNWLVDVPFDAPFRCRVKIRYRTPPADATVIARADGTLRAVLDEPRFGVAPGQSLVCYYGDRLLGGGVIKAV